MQIDFTYKYSLFFQLWFLLDIGLYAANLLLMASRDGGKEDKPSVVTGAPDRLEIQGPLVDQLRAAAKEASASLGRRVTPQEYALAVLEHALDQARIGRQVSIPYSRE
jgi:hypothetical protein